MLTDQGRALLTSRAAYDLCEQFDNLAEAVGECVLLEARRVEPGRKGFRLVRVTHRAIEGGQVVRAVDPVPLSAVLQEMAGMARVCEAKDEAPTSEDPAAVLAALVEALREQAPRSEPDKDQSLDDMDAAIDWGERSAWWSALQMAEVALRKVRG